ncbi:MAG TPA: DUF4188 domain-containing protein, partial [Candidatus Thermoplasmatota archaeon]|nr:DUF4188 domain-containing protein [Candidatus Thermoplasmatota archaeon]
MSKPGAYSAGWRVDAHVKRTTVDLSAYPDLVVMVLAIRLNSPRGVPTALKFMRRMREASRARPEGLLHHEPVVFPWRQFGMRHYWRDFDALERWARAPPHRDWWVEYLQDTKGTGFWHETYFMRGGFEAIYDNVRSPVGMLAFAPQEAPVGGMFTARRRLRLEGRERAPPPISD